MSLIRDDVFVLTLGAEIEDVAAALPDAQAYAQQRETYEQGQTTQVHMTWEVLPLNDYDKPVWHADSSTGLEWRITQWEVRGTW